MTYPLESDLQAAYDDCGETWETAAGAEFAGIFRLLRSDEVDVPGATRQAVHGELRWMASDMASVEPDTLLYRQGDGKTWQVIGDPEDDNLGEVIARVRRLKRSRLGVQ